ncbi:MAG: hypothetical protein M0Z57_07075 [Deltaproteobacteria bacterium]|jgi:hypothetical protein|nr:hypothetical protein [Deltaproteobacteria bacterium]
MTKKKTKQEKVSPVLNLFKLFLSIIGWLVIFAISGVLLILAVKHVFAATYGNGVCTFKRPLGYRHYNRITGQGYDPYYMAAVTKDIYNRYFSGTDTSTSIEGVNIAYSNTLSNFTYEQSLTNGGYSANFYYAWQNGGWEYTEDPDIAELSTEGIMYMIPGALEFGPVIPVFNSKNYYEWWINNALNYYETQQPAWFSYNNKQITEGWGAWECERAFRGYPITQITYTNRLGRSYTRSLLTVKFPRIQPSSAGSCPPLPISILFGFEWCVKHGL